MDCWQNLNDRRLMAAVDVDADAAPSVADGLRPTLCVQEAAPTHSRELLFAAFRLDVADNVANPLWK